MAPMLLLALAPALAEDLYDPTAIGVRSDRFREATEHSGRAFTDASAQSERLSGALHEYELGLDLLGTRASEDERERLRNLQRQFGREHAILQDFAQRLADDYEHSFSSAVERAIAGHPGHPNPCVLEIPTGPGLPGIPRRTRPNPECEERDVTDDIVHALDEDPTLVAELEALYARPWPTIHLDASPQSPTDDREAWLSVTDFFQAIASGALERIEEEDRSARLPFAAALESGEDPATLQQYLEQARSITRATADKRTDLAEPAFLLADKLLERRIAPEGPSLGWCANPTLLGGCTGRDETGRLLPELLDHPKIRRLSPL